jgi:hypothetical protein
MSKELDALTKKLMKRSEREVKIESEKRRIEQEKNDPLFGKSKEFRQMVSYSILGSLFMKNRGKE